MSIPQQTYSLVLNSQTSPNITNNSNLSAYSYNVNWAGILPQQHKKYNVSFQLKSYNTNTNTTYFQGTQSSATILVVNVLVYGTIFIGMQYYNLNVLTTVISFISGTGGAGSYGISGGAINASSTFLYSINSASNKHLLININFGKSNTYDSSSNISNQLGILCQSPYQINPNMIISNYNSIVSDNAPILINYPTNNTITVSFNTFDGLPFTQMPHYCLQLYFTPLIDNED